ncbi:M28 family peptidase [candidate division KSB1 bacterium]|nr:M28 family peptidase [candidate division KSB1 bacterium]
MKSSRLILLVVLAVFALNSFVLGQEPIRWEAIQKIREEGFQRSQVMETLSYLTDVYGPRLAGSPEYKEAAEWAKSRLEEYGMVNVALEPYPRVGRGWTNNYVSVHMLEPRYMPIIGYPPTNSPGTDGKITGQVIYIDFSTIQSEADLAQYMNRLNNAIVISSPVRALSPNFTPDALRLTEEELDEMEIYSIPVGQEAGRGGRGRGRGGFGRGGRGRGQADGMTQAQIREYLMANGVAAFAQPGSGEDGTVFVSGGGRGGGGSSPTVVMAAEHYNRIFRILEKGIPVTLEIEINNSFTDEYQEDYNVVAEIRGTDLADEIVMLGGHFDSWHAGTGATDNAAGSAIAIEAMRV